MIRGLFGPGTIILGGVAVVMIGLIAVGFILPTEWAASAEARIEVGPDVLLEYVDSPEGWRTWTAWPDSGLVRSGPERGAGARIAWSDRELGSGSFTIAEIGSGPTVGYAVEVEGAANTVLTTTGVIAFEADGDATRIRWSESGDLGRNPLMGYWAMAMERAQSTEMTKSLTRLAAVVDSLSR